MSKRLPVKREWDYDRVGSFTDGNPFAIAFVYPMSKNREAFVLKGGAKDVERYLEKKHYPYIIHKTYWYHGHSRRFIQIKNLLPDYHGYITKEGTKHNVHFHVTVYKKTGSCWSERVFFKDINRIPRKWMKELDQFASMGE